MSSSIWSKGALRRGWMWVHRWIGVLLFIALTVLGVTGSALVWPTSFEALVHPARFAVADAPAALAPSVYAAAAQDALPDGDRVSAMQLPRPGAPGAVLVGGAPKLDAGRKLGPPPRNRVWLDPATAEVAATHDGSKDLLFYARALHGHLHIAGPAGRAVVGWLGWAMFVSCISGLWLWWPRNNKVVKALRWRRTPSVLNNLHHQVGLWIGVPLAVVSLTGTYFTFPQSYHAVFRIATGEPAPARAAASHDDEEEDEGPPPQIPLAATRMTVDDAVAAALDAHSGGAAGLIVWPRDGAPDWEVTVACDRAAAPSEQAADAPCLATYVVADRSGAVSRRPARTRSQAEEIGGVVQDLHAGERLGPIWSVVVFVTGLVPALFGVTGVVMWLTGRRQRRARAALAAAR